MAALQIRTGSWQARRNLGGAPNGFAQRLPRLAERDDAVEAPDAAQRKTRPFRFPLSNFKNFVKIFGVDADFYWTGVYNAKSLGRSSVWAVRRACSFSIWLFGWSRLRLWRHFGERGERLHVSSKRSRVRALVGRRGLDLADSGVNQEFADSDPDESTESPQSIWRLWFVTQLSFKSGSRN